VNEDAAGVVERDGQVEAAWVFDGVTGINGGHLFPGESDAAWLVTRADHHVRALAGKDLPLIGILERLVAALKDDVAEALSGLQIPAEHDAPAACLILVKRYGAGWQALRLGDSLLLSRRSGEVIHHPLPPSDLHDLEQELRREALNRRQKGPVDFKQLLAAFKPRIADNRRRRNTPGSYGILVADDSALAMPEVIDLGAVSDILLCTDGFYRAVDVYGRYDDAGLLAACVAEGGVTRVLEEVRATEAADPTCQTHLRFKPGDDASAVMLCRG
jgi:hypothetical protein